VVDDQTSLSLATVSVAAVKHSRHSRQASLNQRFHYTAKSSIGPSARSSPPLLPPLLLCPPQPPPGASPRRANASPVVSRCVAWAFNISRRLGSNDIPLGNRSEPTDRFLPRPHPRATAISINGIDAESDFPRESTASLRSLGL